MPKALMGAHVQPQTLQLLDEIRALRGRVAQLEKALAEAEAARDERIVRVDEVEAVKA